MSDEAARKAERIAGPRSGARNAYIVTCPSCGFKGGDRTDFNISLCDECECPKCGERFELGDPEAEEDDDE